MHPTHRLISTQVAEGVFADESRWRLAATDDVALQIRPQTDAADTKRYYRSCGRLVAKALFDGQVRASVS